MAFEMKFDDLSQIIEYLQANPKYEFDNKGLLPNLSWWLSVKCIFKRKFMFDCSGFIDEWSNAGIMVVIIYEIGFNQYLVRIMDLKFDRYYIVQKDRKWNLK